MLATLLSSTLVGLDGRVIRVEVDVAPGLPGFAIVGLADAALQEARERVRGAIRNAGFVHPPRRITVNLAPADLRKAGASLDLAIAIGILVGSEQVRAGGSRVAMIGELSLGGEVQVVPGILPMAAALARRGVRRVVVPAGSVDEARLGGGIEVIGVASLREAADVVRSRRSRGDVALPRRIELGDSASSERSGTGSAPTASGGDAIPPGEAPGLGEAPDLAEVRGQLEARRALEIALAGGHGLLAIYCRISQDRTGAGLGVERQREDCERLAESRGWGIAGLYVDNDLSAFSGKRRPEYERLLTDVREGRIGAILAWHPDRLHRSPLELETFIATVEAAGTRIETVRAGHVDLATPSGRVVARTLGAMARYESEHKADRITRKHEELARAGQPIRGGTRAFGLTADWTAIVDDEAALIHEAYARVLDGATVGSIAADWQSRGILSPAGLTWRPGPLRRLLTSARLAGLREHRGAIVAAGVWPAIVDRATWERVRATLATRTPRAGTPRRYLLTGLVRCGACGVALIGRPRADHVRRYVCAKGPNFDGCGRTYILAEKTEAAVVEMVLAVLDGPETEAAIRREAAMLDRTDDVDRLAEDERGLEDLARDHYVDRIIGRAEYLAARDGLEARITTSRAALAAGGHGRRLAAALTVRGRWDDLTFARRREVVETVLESVTILPGRRGYNRFDVARLDPVWRV